MRAGRRKAERTVYETHLSAFGYAPQAYTWLSCAHENQGRASGYQCPPRQGPASVGGLAHSLPGRYAYTRRQRLLKGTDFEAVFAARLYYRSRSYLVMCRPNELGYARLGMVVGKRQFKRAVDRNRMRRIIRETFRLHHPDLPAMDVVVKVQSVPPEGEEGAELAAVLARLK